MGGLFSWIGSWFRSDDEFERSYQRVKTDPETPAAAGGSAFWPAVFVIVLLLALALGIAGTVMGIFGVDAYNNYYPRSCSDLTINGLQQTGHREIFVFSNSLDDFGNWLSDIPPLGYYYLDDNRTVEPSTSDYNVFPAGPGKHSVNHVSLSGRWGGAMNAMDYLAQYLKLKTFKSSDIKSYNANVKGHDSFLVNFAIGGATANGNVYNAPLVPLPHDFNQVAGSFGYNYQVNEFVAKFVTNSEYRVKPTTWFFYQWVGANDFPLILQCTNVTACLITFTATHLSNIQTLYNAGMRNLVLTLTDGGYQYNPETLKVDPTGFDAAFLNAIASATNSPTGSFFTQFLTQMYTLMPDLQVYTLRSTAIITDIVNELADYGIRQTLAKDPDPLNPYLNLTSAFPFPTLIDYNNTYGAILTKTFYYDDNHATMAGYEAVAAKFVKAMMSEYKVCNTAPLGPVT